MSSLSWFTIQPLKSMVMETMYAHVIKTWENVGNAYDIMLEKSKIHECLYTNYNYEKYQKEK